MNLKQLIDNFKNKYYLPDILEEYSTDFASSELVKIVRPITKNEIAQLIQQGNRCTDWSLFLVEPDFNVRNVYNNSFSGRIFLGNYSGKLVSLCGTISLPTGIYDSYLHDVYIGSECVVKNNRMISRYCIGENCVVVGNDFIYSDTEVTFGNGTVISVGSEVGGRDITLYAEMDIQAITDIISGDRDEGILTKYEEMINSYVEGLTSSYGVISEGARVVNNRKIMSSYIGKSAVIDNTTLIENCSILSEPDEVTTIKGGSILKNSLCQWGVTVDTMALLENVLLCEYSGVERFGKVKDSIIGSNSVIGEGEVTSSLIGPFVGFHHQSMLIGSIWAEGRGNIGHGANVGSNHTSKLPDQELFCGEGLFYGLGTNIKFPADYRGAAYSIIATGVTTLPQKVLFPFSLICEPFSHHKEVAPAYNELIPGWVLSDNSYSVFRNEDKYLNRNKARRTSYDYRIFREDICDKMMIARDLLNTVSGKDIYTDRDIPGLGKNFVTESNRVKAIEIYRLFLKYYLLKELSSGIELNEYLKQLGKYLELEIGTPEEIKEQFHELFNDIIQLVIQSKMKDQIRGEKIIDDYAEWHEDIENDRVIKLLLKQLNTI